MNSSASCPSVDFFPNSEILRNYRTALYIQNYSSSYKASTQMTKKLFLLIGTEVQTNITMIYI